MKTLFTGPEKYLGSSMGLGRPLDDGLPHPSLPVLVPSLELLHFELEERRMRETQGRGGEQ